ncbi:hypothetical protein evm_007587 [Chilo suppressalis]|nr:hypothetical protein evm_007587 [Chilo suppressalis]
MVVPSVKAGALADDNCALCGDKFELFYHDDEDEWHLKDSVRYEEKTTIPSASTVSIRDNREPHKTHDEQLNTQPHGP